MSKIKITDFYYGSVLSVLFNNKARSIKPALVEGDDRRVYNIMTDNTEFKLFIKYRTHKQKIKTGRYNSWSFSLSDDNITELSKYLDEGCNLILALVCGNGGLKESEIALLDKNQVKEIIVSYDKKSITLSRKSQEQSFRISIGGGRDNSIRVRADRFKELFG